MSQTVFPSLVTTDMEATVAWYQNNLGAEVKMSVPSKSDPNKARFVTITVEGNDIMLETVAGVEDKYPQLKGQVAVGYGLALNVQVADAQAVYDALADKSGIIAEPANTFYGMREFTIKDPNGYLMTIASRLENR